MNTTPRFGAGFTGGTCAAAAAFLIGSSALATPPRPGTAPPDRRDQTPVDRSGTRQDHGASAGDAMRVAEVMRSSKVSLGDAIEAAEKHSGGQAIEARSHARSGAGGLFFDVTCLDKAGNLVVVNIDGATGKVSGTNAHKGGDGMAGARQVKIVKATEVVGRDVVDATNQKIADIEDLAIDIGRGRVAYAVLDMPNASDRYFAVPWTALRHHGENCQLDLGAQRRLNDAPHFERERWPDMTASDFGRRTSDFYGDRPYGEDVAVSEGRTFLIMKSSDIIGGDVRSTTDENLGDIEDLAIDMKSGRVAYAVVSFGGFLGFGDKLFAIPMESFTRDAKGNWVLATSKDRLKEAPGFDKKNWPNMADPTFDRQMRDFYTPRDTDRTRSGTSRPQQQPPTAPQR